MGSRSQGKELLTPAARRRIPALSAMRQPSPTDDQPTPPNTSRPHLLQVGLGHELLAQPQPVQDDLRRDVLRQLLRLLPAEARALKLLGLAGGRVTGVGVRLVSVWVCECRGEKRRLLAVW